VTSYNGKWVPSTDEQIKKAYDWVIKHSDTGNKGRVGGRRSREREQGEGAGRGSREGAGLVTIIHS
jgi:hypothetical protein